MSECANGEMRDLLPELVSGLLSAEMQLAVEAHVAECEECADELALLRALRPALMRAPAIDTERIAAAVRAQVSASARRGSTGSALPWRLAMAAAALIAVSAAGYLIAVRGRNVVPEIAVVHTHDVVAPAPAPTPEAPLSRTALPPTPHQQVAVAPPHVLAPTAPAVPMRVASTDVLENLSDLSDDDVLALTASLNAMSGVPSAELSSEIDPLGATLDDLSAGGSR